MNQTFETTTPLTINASVPAGTIEIEATDDAAGTAVDVERLDKELDPSEVELRLRGSEGAQTLEIKLGKWRFKEARYRLLVRTHSGTDLRIDSGAADIRADGVFGSAKVHSASGDIAIPSGRGDGNLKTASGDVRVAVAHRDVEMDSASGGVDLGEVHGRAKLHTVSGDVEI